MTRRRREVDDFIHGDPHIVEGRGPLVPPDRIAKKNFESLLAGRVIGGFKEITFPTGAIPFASLVNITGPDHSAMAMTITLAPPPSSKPRNVAVLQPDPDTGIYSRFDGAVAMVSWGSGGVLTYAEVDYGRGAVFSLYCSSLQISARRVIPPSGGPTAITREEWGAFVSHLPSARTSPLTLTTRFYGVIAAGGGSQLFTPPPFAKTVRFLVTTLAAATGYNVAFLDGDGVTIGAFDVAAGALCPEATMPNDCAIVRLTNTGAVATSVQECIFGLAL